MNRFGWALALAISLTSASSLLAATKPFSITVTGGSGPATQVAMPLAVAEADANASVTLTDSTGKTLVGQLTAPSLLRAPAATAAGEVARELHFRLPRVDDKPVTLQVTFAPAAEPGAKAAVYRWEDTPGQYADLKVGDKPVLRYMYTALDEKDRENTFKPFHHVYAPDGSRLVTKGAGGKFTHHRGLFFGFNRVSYEDGNKKADVWHCSGDAYQSHEKVVASEVGPVLGRQVVEIAWHGPGKEVFAIEHRELTAYQADGGTLIEFASRVNSKVGPIKLDGDPQHAGFHFRADNEVNDKTKGQTYYLRTDGKDAPGKTRNWDPKTKAGPVDLPWNAMSFVLGDKRYTVAYLDRPQNPKEARFSERDYGRFGSYFEYTIEENKPLEVNYRVWLQDGEMEGPQVEALDQDFVKPAAVTKAAS